MSCRPVLHAHGRNLRLGTKSGAGGCGTAIDRPSALLNSPERVERDHEAVLDTGPAGPMPALRVADVSGSRTRLHPEHSLKSTVLPLGCSFAARLPASMEHEQETSRNRSLARGADPETRLGRRSGSAPGSRHHTSSHQERRLQKQRQAKSNKNGKINEPARPSIMVDCRFGPAGAHRHSTASHVLLSGTWRFGRLTPLISTYIGLGVA
jgi:hypothetical protein